MRVYKSILVTRIISTGGICIYNNVQIDSCIYICIYNIYVYRYKYIYMYMYNINTTHTESMRHARQVDKIQKT